jgi:hypothetical protein
MNRRARAGTPEGGAWTVRFLREGEEQALLDHLQRAFRRWPNADTSVEAIEHLRWKTGTSRQIVAVAGGRIEGARIIFAQPAWVRGRTLKGRQAADISVGRALRGRGILTAMRAYSPDGFDGQFDLHLGGHSVQPAILKLDERELRLQYANRIEALARPLTLRAALSLAASRFDGARRGPHRELALPRWTAAQLRERIARRPATPWSIAGAPCFDERTDAFWEEARGAFDFMVARTRDYLRWRYCDPRAGDFTVRLADQGGALLGYTVLRVSRGRGYLADILALPGRTDVARSLIRDALDQFRGLGIGRADCWLPSHHPYRRAFAAAGFVHRRIVGPTWTPLALPMSELAFLGNDPRAAIHYTLGDTDLV